MMVDGSTHAPLLVSQTSLAQSASVLHPRHVCVVASHAGAGLAH
jgi:hypothetical protein